MKKLRFAFNIILVLVGFVVLSACAGAWESAEDRSSKIESNTIAGFVFRDLNGNGIREEREPGEPDITVSVYDDADQLITSTLSDIEGEYQLVSEKINAEGNYTVIFSGWKEILQPGPQGADSNTEIQFVSGGDGRVNFGLQNPDQYIQPDAPSETTDQAFTTGPGDPAANEPAYQGADPAPEFPEGAEWFNVTHPLTLEELRGKVVVLQFFTYGCVTSNQDIFKLEMLKSAFPNEVVVIGVHANKFPHEGESENIREYLQRNAITHPVVNDTEYALAAQYGANIWPTYVLISPEGTFLGMQEGGLKFEQWQPGLADVLAEFESLGKTDPAPLTFVSHADFGLDTLLRYPSTILADEAHDRLFISDAGNNRILITDLDGALLDVIGSTEAGWQDGSFENAAFLRPQGLALADENTLYIADTENQVIRRADLQARTVTTIAGVNERVYIAADAGPALKARLSYPWGLLYQDGLLYVSMMGQHQIWIYNPQSEEMILFAGTGVEKLIDGPLLQAAMNQPTALTSDGEILYFTDSEASAIRQLDMNPAGSVQTIVGHDFFVFGDADGVGDDVLLQRPSGIAYYEGLLYVADSYNNKIKIIDPSTRESTTYLGEDASFNEPGGVSIAANQLYIADTNNHRIRIVDLVTDQISTLEIRVD